MYSHCIQKASLAWFKTYKPNKFFIMFEVHTFFLKKGLFLFMCMNACQHTYMYVYCLYAWYLQRPEDIRSLGIGVIDDCKLL